MLKKRFYFALKFVLFFIFFLAQLDNNCKALTLNPIGIKLSAALALITKPADLPIFTDNIINYTLYNNAAYINYPNTTNSIYTKVQFFYDARVTELLPYQTTLLSMLSAAKPKYFFNSTQAAMVASWYSTLNTELLLYNNFPQLLSLSNTPKLMLTNIAQQASYNKAYYQGTNIFATINTFYTSRMQKLGTNLNYLQELLELLNACSGKIFLSDASNAMILSMIPTLSTDIAQLTKVLSDFQAALNQNATKPYELYTNILINSAYNKEFFKDYPSPTNSVYTVLKNLFTNRETSLITNKNFVTDLQKATSRALAVSTNFLTDIEKTDVASMDATLLQEIALLAKFNTSFTGATSVANLTTVCKDTTFNRTYFQDYPSTTNSIYTKIKGFYAAKTQTLLNLTGIINLLTAAQNKAFLTTLQNTDVSNWLKAVTTDLDILTVKNNFTTDVNAASTADEISTVVKNTAYDQTYLQNFAATTTLFTKIQNLVNTATLLVTQNFVGTTTQTIAILTSLKSLLTATQNKAFLTTAQNTNIGTWLTQSTSDLATLSDPTIAVKNSFTTDVNAASTIAQVLAVVNNSAYNQTYLQNFAATTTLFTKIQNLVSTTAQTITAQTNLKNLLTATQNKAFLTTTQNTSIGTWLAQATSDLATLSDPTIAVKNNFTTDVNAASTMAQVLAVVNNSAYNQTYLQNFAATTTLFTKIQNLYNSAIATPSATNLTNIKTLLTTTQNKNFLIAAQNTSISTWLAQATSDLATLSDPTIAVKNSFSTDVNAASTMAQVLAVVNNTTYNQIYLQNFEASTALFTKIQNLYNSAIATPSTTTLTNIKTLLTATQNKAFLTTAQNTSIGTWLTQTTSDLAILIDPTTAVKNSFTTDVNAASTMTQILAVVNNTAYNQTYLQNFEATTELFDKIQNLYNTRNKNTTDLTNLQNLLTNTLSKNFLTDVQKNNAISWQSTVNSEINGLMVAPPTTEPIPIAPPATQPIVTTHVKIDKPIKVPAQFKTSSTTRKSPISSYKQPSTRGEPQKTKGAPIR